MSTISYKGYHGIFGYDPEADSVADSLNFCASKGKALEKPYLGHFNVCLDSELHQCIALQAVASGKSLNGWVADAPKGVVQHQHSS